MNHSGRLINLNLKAKSLIKHEFDECLVFDYHNYGFDPYFKKYEGIKPLDWRFSNQDQIFEDIFVKLKEKEPLFNETSPKFKEILFSAMRTEFTLFYDKIDFYEDIPFVNWSMIYPTFYTLLKNKKLSEKDLILKEDLDLFFMFLVTQVNKIVPNFYKRFNKDMRENDPILYKKLQDYHNKKAS